MDSSSDSYLHKKFKKQQCFIGENKNVQSGKTSPSVQNKENQKNSLPTNQQTQQQEQCGKIVNDISVNNNNTSVPTQSTNSSINCTSLSSTISLSSVQSSSLSVTSPITYNFVKSSISNVESLADNNRISWNGEHQLDNARSSGNQQFPTANNSCISYVISNPGSRINVTNFANSREPPNFDIKYNNAYDLTTSATSSILENSYPNQYQYVGGKILVRAEEISSRGNQENQLIQDQNQKIKREDSETQDKILDTNTPDKTSGGKYVCNYCNLVCSKPSVLQKHIRAHTNERPFPCISCGFSFKTRSNLYKHCRSRTHANRVMGNKAQEITNDIDVEKSDLNSQNLLNEIGREDNRLNDTKIQDMKQKPYKPRFKGVFDNASNENAEHKILETPKSTSSDLLSLRIDELIHKNNSIVLVGSNDPYLFKKKNPDSNYVENNNEYRYREAYSPNNLVIEQRNEDEPLNLTNKNRKRCMSEVSEPIVQKSLIKELLLKNLYADSNKQCPHCKMIFQTVTELDLHKLRSCKGYSKTGARYSRSSSVNVASILTQNKNAFDTNPHIPNTVFSLKSPGPFLGKTRLVESDKSKSFSFDDSIQTTSLQSSFSNTHDMKTRYSLSPLTLSNDKSKKPPVKMFGGEVKITQTSGETKSFKIDGKEERYERNYIDYGGSLSENRVVKSTLQSGGTVLHNKSNTYNKPDPKKSSPDIIRVYDNTDASPSIDMIKNKFNFSRPDVIVDHSKSFTNESNASVENITSSSHKYTNIMDYSQNAIKQFTPKLRQPNLSIPGITVPTKIVLPQRPPLFVDVKNEKPTDSWQKIDNMNISTMPAFPKDTDTDRRNSENIDFAQKQILLQQKMTAEPPKLQVSYNPMNVLVNGKIIRYVPGIPGPITAEPPLDMAYSSNIGAISPKSSINLLQKPNIRVTPIETKTAERYSPKNFHDRSLMEINRSPKLQNNLLIKTDVTTRTNEMRSPKMSEMKSPKPTEIKSPKPSEMKSPRTSESKSPIIKSPSVTPSTAETPKKFARPNSLALKPMIPGSKQHHGLTPTIFNQILISPDTPRVAKKYNHQILHGNYFSYLGLKSSTKPTYCTLNKTQPFYVPHFKRLSMYSEWTQRDTKTDKLFLSAYDSRQKQQKYTTSGKAKADLIVHSSYKFTVAETTTVEEPAKNILGGYESNDDYTYVRGRGRGRYVCDQCGIRCKKPSMLKKHIRTHSNDRPFTCSHCNFSFKTKGNLTKHMKSKAHTKNYAAYSSSSSNSSAQQSGTPTSESDTDDSGMDSSDESSTRHQEREAVYGLLSLSQKPTVSENRISSPNNMSINSSQSLNIDSVSSFMDTEQIAHVTKTNYAKNKILDHSGSFNTSKLSEISATTNSEMQEKHKLSHFLGKTNTNRPLTYPYTNALSHEMDTSKEISDIKSGTENNKVSPEKNDLVKQFQVVKKYSKYPNSFEKFHKNVEDVPYEENVILPKQSSERKVAEEFEDRVRPTTIQVSNSSQNVVSDLRKRKGSTDHDVALTKIQKSDSEVMDLSITSNVDRNTHANEIIPNGFIYNNQENNVDNSHIVSDTKKNKEISNTITQMSMYDKTNLTNTNFTYNDEEIMHQQENSNNYETEQNLSKTCDSVPMETSDSNHISTNYIIQEQPNTQMDQGKYKQADYDNSAMETLADIATKQEKLEKNSIAKNVASEFLKLVTKNEYQNNDGLRDSNFISNNKDVNELIGKPEENKSCTICSKSFCKPSQLKLHMNIHYLERPYRCDSCSVSFRTKGHLQKHERSASHHNKLSSSPNLSSSEPRPFKCSDCNIAFRIHGHLAKHLRAKMHIMKLECLNKIPFGLYAELERSNSLLTEINTTDGDQCLESLKMLAKKVFTNDPSKLNQMGPSSTESIDTDS